MWHYEEGVYKIKKIQQTYTVDGQFGCLLTELRNSYSLYYSSILYQIIHTMESTYNPAAFDPSKHSRLFAVDPQVPLFPDEQKMQNMESAVRAEMGLFEYGFNEEQDFGLNKPEAGVPMAFASEPMEPPKAFKLETRQQIASSPLLTLTVPPPRMVPIKLEEGFENCSKTGTEVYPDASYLCPHIHKDFVGRRLTAESSSNKVFAVQSLPNPVLEDIKMHNETTPEAMQGDDQSPISKGSPAASYASGDGSAEKKSKQERNRESARKCRQRKKEYMNRLEAELKSVKEELAACKNELAIARANSMQGLNQQFKQMKKQLLDQTKKLMELGKPAAQLNEYLYYLNVLPQQTKEKIGQMWGPSS
eukprot:TRINITY_DN72555_c0_g1_i1.p1 TRINITY_DN72555_c0_g1~~TRINITY_DN72555_c0_g1_i1.p1  ORF type:complete len:362 (+),score=27.52 TRINITY_DN72555_c0_g1_i1:934-2019(+)